MSNVIPFPGIVRTIGETYQSTTLHAGLAEAERHGIPGDRLAALPEEDRQFVAYFLSLLGSDDEQDRRGGALGLARLLGATGGAA